MAAARDRNAETEESIADRGTDGPSALPPSHNTHNTESDGHQTAPSHASTESLIGRRLGGLFLTPIMIPWPA